MGISERKERERELRRRLILETAEALFEQKGISSTTMDEIAAACELSKGTLYLYYQNKDDLVFAIICKALDVLYATMIQNLEGVSGPVEKLDALRKSYWDYCSQHLFYYRLMTHTVDAMPAGHDYAGLGEHVAEVFTKNERVWALTTQAIDEGIHSGVFDKKTEAAQTAIMLWAASNGVIAVYDHFQKHMQAFAENPAMREAIEEYVPIPSAPPIDIGQMMQRLWDTIIASIQQNNTVEAS